jgi:hypothetical protein
MRKFSTTQEVFVQVAERKPMSYATLYKHLQALRIRPLGVRQSPQIYPANTANRILRRLGIA